MLGVVDERRKFSWEYCRWDKRSTVSISGADEHVHGRESHSTSDQFVVRWQSSYTIRQSGKAQEDA